MMWFSGFLPYRCDFEIPTDRYCGMYNGTTGNDNLDWVALSGATGEHVCKSKIAIIGYYAICSTNYMDMYVGWAYHNNDTEQWHIICSTFKMYMYLHW